MKKNFIIGLLLLAVLGFTLQSCRNDLLPEPQEAYNNSSQFKLYSKRITLDESKHKPKLVSELQQAENDLKKIKVSVAGKTIDYDNFTVDTDNIIFMENGPNYHTYTFRIIRNNEQENAHVENLVFTPLADGTYRKLLMTYNFTPQEKEILLNGGHVNTKGKSTVTELGTGTLPQVGKGSQNCGYVVAEYYTTCSSGEHSNGQTTCKASVKSYLISVYLYVCTSLDDGSGSGGGGSTGDGGGGDGPPIDWGCPNPQVLTGPQQPGSDVGDGGCYGVPTDPNLGGGSNSDDPCQKSKTSITNANNVLKNFNVQQKMDAILKEKINASKEWTLAIGKKPNGYEVTSAVEQNATSGSIPTSVLTSPYIGDGHSHAGNRGVPSGADFYNMIKLIQNGSIGLQYRFVYGNNNGSPEVYALVIDDQSLAIQFLTQFPKDKNYDEESQAIKEDSPLGVEFYKAKKHFSEGRSDDTSGENYEARAVAMAHILEKFNVGMSIANVDTNGNLKKINAKVGQITVPGSGGVVKEGVKVSKCP